MIKVDNLSFKYGRRKKEILHDFSLNFSEGTVYGLLGKNGTGKSTLLYLMTGLLTPLKGNVMINGIDVRRRYPITLNEIFLVPEEFNLPSIPLKEYVAINAPFYPKFSQDLMEDCLKNFEMDTDLNLGALSMGQKKKVFMSFAFATNTSILIMDEPTNGLDIPGKSQFRKLIATKMTDDKTIIISTHQVRDIDKIIDHVIIMDSSKVLLNQSTAKISKALLFIESNEAINGDKNLYSLPSPQGYSVMMPNENDEDSEINLELLFGGMLTNPDKINNLFHNSNTDK